MENRRVLPIRALIMVIFSFVVLSSIPAGAYTILTPPTGGKLLVRARRGAASLVIQAAEGERRSLQVGRITSRQGAVENLVPAGSWQKDGSYYVHYALSLKKGINTFVVKPGGRKVIVRYQPQPTLPPFGSSDSGVYLFHRKDVVPGACRGCHDRKLPADSGLEMKELEKNSNFSPVCFSCHRRLISGSKWLHGPSANLDCLACHRRGQGNNKKIAVPTGRVPGICYRCHVNERKWKTKAFVHGPIRIGDCTVCHDPHSANYKFELWADPKTGLCIACHSDKRQSVQKTKGFHRHGIIVGSGCGACHDPHASDYPFQLYRPINKLCAGCHLRLQGMTSGHPVGGHPLSGKPDPRHKGRELSCASCHRPHGSNYQYLLIGSPLGGRVCTKCHH